MVPATRAARVQLILFRSCSNGRTLTRAIGQILPTACTFVAVLHWLAAWLTAEQVDP